MKTILYATDYSESSIAALKYAYNMSLKINTKLLAVHVFDFPKTISSREEDISKELLTGHQTKLTDFCEEHLAWESDNAPVKTEVIVNPSIVHGIVEKAKEVQACLIIMGMKGTSRLRTMIMGSTTRDLIENAPYPVLTIPKDISYKQIKTMVYASDFQSQDLGAINRLVEIAEPLGAKVKIIHVSPIEHSVEEGQRKVNEEKLNKYVKYHNMELYVSYSNDIFTELQTYLTKNNADVVAMLERESSSYGKKLFYKSLVEKMKVAGEIPLMSFNAKNYGMFHL